VVWHLLSVLCAIVAAHWLATALERTSTDVEVRSQKQGCWRWWAVRFVPLFVCLAPIFATLVHGQVNLLLLLLLSGSLASHLQGRPWRAGLFLSGAICLKVFPAFLLLYPLWHRNLRFVAGCLLGMVIGLVAIPVAVWGPAQAWETNRRFAEVVLLPGLGRGSDQSVAKELTNPTATDSQSLLAVAHNTLHPNRDTRPPQATEELRQTMTAIGLLLTGVVFLAAWKRRDRSAATEMMFFG